MFARMLRARRMAAFPAELEKRLSICSSEERTTTLIYALDYCLKLRRNSDSSGARISMALLDPSNLTAQDCEGLYSHLEGVHSKIRAMTVSDVELKAVAERNGKQIAQDYKASLEEPARFGSIGVGVLMTRLSYRLGRLQAVANTLHEPATPYTHMASMLRDSISHIGDATRKHNRVTSTLTPVDVWSDETVSFVENSARIIAMTYPG